MFCKQCFHAPNLQRPQPHAHLRHGYLQLLAAVCFGLVLYATCFMALPCAASEQAYPLRTHVQVQVAQRCTGLLASCACASGVRGCSQSSPQSSQGCGVRSEPFPQRRSSAGQYWSQPQHNRSGWAGTTGNFLAMSLVSFPSHSQRVKVSKLPHELGRCACAASINTDCCLLLASFKKLYAWTGYAGASHCDAARMWL